MAEDIFTELSNRANELGKAGFHDYRDSIISSIRDGSTGNEIYMALRFHIETILDDKAIESPLKCKIAHLYEEICRNLSQ